MSKLAYDMSIAEQRSVLALHRKQYGIDFGHDTVFCKPDWKENIEMAMDAQPSLVTTSNSGVPAYLTYFTDPDLLRVLTAPNAATEIFGEKQKGSWTDTTLLFPVVEQTYEVSSYGDYNSNGSAGINTNFPQRQSYLYQVIVQYGEKEIAQAGLAKIGFVQEQKNAAIMGLNKYANLSYFFGVAGLQNYGALNDPALYPAISPAPKANGGVSWMNGTVINATANEVFADIQGMVTQLITQSSGVIDIRSKFVLALSPNREVALTATNSFGISVGDLLKKNFPGLDIKTAVQYGAITAQNPQGSALGETVQLWCPQAGGQDSGFASFNLKLQAGPVVQGLSSFSQKMSQGTNGFILKQPFAMATMVGI